MARNKNKLFLLTYMADLSKYLRYSPREKKSMGRGRGGDGQLIVLPYFDTYELNELYLTNNLSK